MEVRYTPDAVKDLIFWKKSGNKIIQKRIVLLIIPSFLNPMILNQ